LEFRVGDVTDEMVQIDIPENPEAVEDFVLGSVYRRLPGDNDRFEQLLGDARLDIQLRGQPTTTYALAYGGAVAALFLLIVLQVVRARRPQ